ncbi:hypothetical protein ABBQ32_001188 [Trebouxia sp. C0010 RCD-2024]
MFFEQSERGDVRRPQRSEDFKEVAQGSVPAESAATTPAAAASPAPTTSSQSSTLGTGSEDVSVPGFKSVKELIKQLAGPAFSPPQHSFEPRAAPVGAEACRLSQGHRLALAEIADAVTTSGNLAAATEILTQVVSMCQVFPSDSAEVARHYCHRARILLKSGQPLAALQDYLQAAEVDIEGSACLHVAQQLCRWGFLPQLHHFLNEFQTSYAAKTRGQEHGALLRCAASCKTALQDLAEALCEDIGAGITRAAGESLLERLAALEEAFPCHQALLCRKALLELRLSHVHAACTTLDNAVAAAHEMGPVRWACHLRAHVQRLLGKPDQACKLLAEVKMMEKSSLERDVVYDMPVVSAMEDVQEQLEHLDIAWQLINRVLANGNTQAAQAVIKGLHSKQADGGAPMSPACCAQQLILEAGICSHVVQQASDAGSAVHQQSLKGLLACELAVAVDPSVWYQAFAIQNYLLAALGANGIMRDGIRALLRDKAADMTLDMRQAVMDALIQAQQDCQLYGKGPNNHLLFDLADTLDLDKCKSEVMRAYKGLTRYCWAEKAPTHFVMQYKSYVPGLGQLFDLGHEADKRTAAVCGTAAMLNSARDDVLQQPIPEQEPPDTTRSQSHPSWAEVPLLAAQ